MSLVYRAIWQDNLDSVCTTAADVFRSWANGKKRVPDAIPDSGTIHSTVINGTDRVDIEVQTEGATSDFGAVTDAFRAQLVETRPKGQRWHTTVRSWQEAPSGESAAGPAWLWVDVEVVGDVDIRSLAPKAPILARDLLLAGSNPRIGDERLLTRADFVHGAAAGEHLAEELSHFDRSIPFVVLHKNFGAEQRMPANVNFDQVVRTTANAVAGIANVVCVDGAAAHALTEALTESHGLWGGALRIYQKDLDPASPSDSWRHRYVTADRYLTNRSTAADIAGRTIGPISSVRRPPPSFANAKALLNQQNTGSATYAELLEYADTQLQAAEENNAALLDQLRQADEDAQAQALDLDEALEDRLRALDQAEKLTRKVDYLEKQLAELGGSSAFAVGAGPMLPDTASNLSHAVQLAQEHLADRLVIPGEALRDLPVLDSTNTAGAWGNLSWLAFRALHAFADDCANGWDRGGFYEWCGNSKHPLVWRASTKKLAMKESDTVHQSDKLKQCRVLPVATDVDPSGSIFMEAHIKIATGGGNLAPRIYFHFHNPTCTMHVGFFGPHKYMPNSKT
ncbi:hypothetical protein DK926_12865 [Rhodococcus sp. Eu-32]|uniref:hypothetical protein n=1 Tax=Rhodococcus sp. Eu-32 TaxID=1017319 RepID=UPI000DF1894F|nr:hypothetical protein [Rhodococcus sp. Eu-32]RRQ27382.1 hypothetical protein DK926_12865 [Rhodococcus sp. Eu-32]